MAKMNAGALGTQQFDRRLDQNIAKTSARDQRAARLAACQQRFAHDGAGQTSRTFRRIDIERGQQQWLYQTIVEDAFTANGIADQATIR